MDNKLKILSYNIQGFTSVKHQYLQTLCNNNDIIFLQEHWLHQKDSVVFDQYLSNTRSYVVSGMDSRVVTSGRPYGGTAIIWKDTVLMNITPIETNSKRLSVVKAAIKDVSILFCNIYMPVDNTTNNAIYNEVLDEVSSIILKSTDDYVIIAGDLNVDLCRNSQNLKLLKSFISYHKYEILTNSKHCGFDYTFESKANGSRTLIDHFIVSENVMNKVTSYNVLHDVDNLSDHSPVQIILNNINVTYENYISDHVFERLNWSSASDTNIQHFVSVTDALLCKLSIPWRVLHCRDETCTDCNMEICYFYNKLVDILLHAGKQCIPVVGHNRSRKRIVPGWSEHVEKYRQQSVFWHNLWVDNGRPKCGVVFQMRSQARRKYHYAVRWIKKHKDDIEKNKLSQFLLNNNMNDFWKSIKTNKKKSGKVPNIVDNEVGTENICNLFKNKYKSLYTVVGYNDNDMKLIKVKLENEIKIKCQNSHTMESSLLCVNDIITAKKH